MTEEKRESLDAVVDRLRGIAVDATVRAAVAAEIREDIEDHAGELAAAVQVRTFKSLRSIVWELESAHAILEALGMPLFPLDPCIVTEEDARALDEVREKLPLLLQGVLQVLPAQQFFSDNGEYRFTEGGVHWDLLEALRGDPERWWTVRELAKATNRNETVIYGERGINALVLWGLVEVRRVRSERGYGNQQVRRFRIARKDGGK